MNELNKQQAILLAACEVSEKIKEALSSRGLSGRDAERVIHSLLSSLPASEPFASDSKPLASGGMGIPVAGGEKSAMYPNLTESEVSTLMWTISCLVSAEARALRSEVYRLLLASQK